MIAVALAGLIAAAGGVGAQPRIIPIQFRGSPPCVLDKCLQGAEPRPSPRAPVTPPETEPQSAGGDEGGNFRRSVTPPGAFDFYVLSLSWSPGFCETPAASRAQEQCEPGAKLGFVVHGLWPQNRQGYPSDCDAGTRVPSRAALESVRTLYPSQGLARHEWQKHGTCTGLSPTAYFAQVRQARESIAVPDQFVAPADPQTAAPRDIVSAFIASNPRLRADSMAVTCRQNRLEEVRICFSKDLRGFTSCPEVVRASCRRPIEVPPVL